MHMANITHFINLLAAVLSGQRALIQEMFWNFCYRIYFKITSFQFVLKEKNNS